MRKNNEGEIIISKHEAAVLERVRCAGPDGLGLNWGETRLALFRVGVTLGLIVTEVVRRTKTVTIGKHTTTHSYNAKVATITELGSEVLSSYKTWEARAS